MLRLSNESYLSLDHLIGTKDDIESLVTVTCKKHFATICALLSIRILRRYDSIINNHYYTP